VNGDPDRSVYNDRRQIQVHSLPREAAVSKPDLADLLAQARQGEPNALTALHTALEEKLMKAARRRLGRVLRRYVDSVDIVQSAQKSLLICLRQGKYDIPDEDKLTALAMRILQRKVARKWRKARQDLKLRDELAQEPNSRTASPNAAAQAGENAELVRRLMTYMNKTEKELVELLLQGHTITSAAKLRELSPAYARVLIGRMKTRLAGMFELPAGFP
jgi:DNA-directed RNA polymerase specialized sigma24 family protein